MNPPYFQKTTSIAPLVTFRVMFGALMVISIIRFAVNGWIEDLYIEPTYFFTYLGFGWVKPLGAIGMYGVFGIMLLAAIGILVGAFYRLSTILFFTTFTYVELIDKTNYLNHYYFVSLVALILCFLPAHRKYSIDVHYRGRQMWEQVPRWTIDILKFQLALVYIFAGIAKLNTNWLLDAMPLKLWLPAKAHIPIIGSLMTKEWIAYTFAWCGAAYDLLIVFFLLWKPTRALAYMAVVLFHFLTWALFQIGMFPWIMMGATLIFFSVEFHELWQKRFLGIAYDSAHLSEVQPTSSTICKYVLGAFILLQLLLPLRYLAYPGQLFWHEQGFRFSWRVMLMEKAGHTTFRIVDSATGKLEYVQNYDYLRPQQEKMMSTQPDMILQFSHHLRDIYIDKGFVSPQVYCDSKVTLNGRRSTLFIDPTVDLAKEHRGWKHKDWIIDQNPK